MKPVLYKEIQATLGTVIINFQLPCNVLLVKGADHWDTLAIMGVMDVQVMESKNSNIVCYRNYEDVNNEHIVGAKGKLFIIPDADFLLSDETRRYIAHDKDNQYLLFGESTANLDMSYAETYKLQKSIRWNEVKYFLERR